MVDGLKEPEMRELRIRREVQSQCEGRSRRCGIPADRKAGEDFDEQAEPSESVRIEALAVLARSTNPPAPVGNRGFHRLAERLDDSIGEPRNANAAQVP